MRARRPDAGFGETDGLGMTERLRAASIAALMSVAFSALLAGCAGSPPPDGKGPRSESMSADQFGQTDFNRTVTLEVRDNLASLYVLLDKLYRRNPREWRKTDAADQPAAVARVKRAIEEPPPPGLSGLRDIQILAVSLDPNYSGDRVAAFIYGRPTPSSPPTTARPGCTCPTRWTASGSTMPLGTSRPPPAAGVAP